jgi:competence protein ComEC
MIGPFGLDPRLRASLGLVALAVFVVVTRWEPSVVRAAAMAGVVLGGRILGLPVEPWRAVGLAVTGLLLVSGDLALDVGFQLSVAATVGVLAAVRLVPRRRPRWLWTALTVTLGAQLAVLPVVLVHFDTVPLLSPMANLVAAPLVTAATVLGGIGAITGLGPVLDLALLAARAVLTVASTAAGWPQVGLGGVVIAGMAAVGLALAGPVRPILAVAACAGLVAWGLPVPPPADPAVVFLDVGQGDAILVRRPPDVVILVDGGRDTAVLESALRRHGVGKIDVLAVTHGDSDHAGGLQGVVDRHRVGEIWYPEGQDHGELIETLLADAAAGGVPVAAMGAGDRLDLGSLRLELLGPRRRYAAENDGSIVTWVTAGGIDVLLTGDVEAIAQAELPPVRPDVLQVPHHGSATTDLDWLGETVGAVAVISVGENTYGHPTPGVLDVLAAAGSTVHTTLGEGDVVVPLCPCPAPP